VDYEGEIAVVVKDSLRRADPYQAGDAILGVTCACDVTARDLQRQWGSFSAAKSFDTFCPLGPSILVDPDLDSLTLVTRVNGETRQQARLSEMTWTLPELLAQASRIFSFEPGDLFLTGTPSGVGTLAKGDLVEVEISGVGVLSNRVEAMRL
jgi:2-keto-4-pentenoate hydratase/2-oxohepta-3-ene-1,7-dioic acid hydratase in catechol pathway